MRSSGRSRIGNAAAYYPEQQLFALIKAGTTQLSYDGVPFFSAAHPLNPNGGGGTYSNIVTGVSIASGLDANPLYDVALAQTNFAKALAAVTAQKFLGGIPRYLRPTVMFVPTALQYRAEQVTGARTISMGDNVLVNRGIEVVVNPLLDDEPNVYYLGVADMLSEDLGPLPLVGAAAVRASRIHASGRSGPLPPRRVRVAHEGPERGRVRPPVPLLSLHGLTAAPAHCATPRPRSSREHGA